MNKYEISQRIAYLIQESMMNDIRESRNSGYSSDFVEKWRNAVSNEDKREFDQLISEANSVDE